MIGGGTGHVPGRRASALRRPGSRWGIEGAEAVLRLRAVIGNGDFEAYRAFHIRREHDRVHQARDRDRYDLIA